MIGVMSVMIIYVQAIWVTLINIQAVIFSAKAEIVNVGTLVDFFQLLPVSFVSLGVSSEVDIFTPAQAKPFLALYILC